MSRTTTIGATALIAVAVAGCGSVRDASQSGGRNAKLGGSAKFGVWQPRDRFIRCIQARGGKVVPIGNDVAQMLPADTSPKVVFAVDRSEATALQANGRAEGGEQIGQAIVYGGRASDAQIEQVQSCM